MSDYQEIRLQHKASGASTAARSPYIGVLLEDELADSCQPGGMQTIKCLHSYGSRDRGRYFPKADCLIEQNATGIGVCDHLMGNTIGKQFSQASSSIHDISNAAGQASAKQ